MTDHDTSRRNVLAGLAAVGVACPVLAACGSGSGATGTTSGTTGGTGNASSGGSPGSTGGGISTSEIPVGGGKVFAGRKVVVTQPKAGELKAFSAVCTHQGCIVANVSDGSINCTCHGSQFSIQDGSVENGPASKPLPEKTVTVTGNTLTVT